MTTAKAPALELFEQQGAFVLDEVYAAAAVTGVGAGKTHSGAVALLNYLSKQTLPTKSPKPLAMVTAPTFPMLRDATLRTINEVWPAGAVAPGGWLAGEMRMVLRNEAEVLFRSTDDPDHLRGPNLSYVWMDEAAQSSLESFRILQGRLRQPGYPPRLRITTTPKGFNWIFEEFGKRQRPNYHLHNWSLRDNPYVSLDFIKSLEESYDESMRLQEIEGKFVAVGNRTQFDRAWLETLLGRVAEPEYEKEWEGGLRVRLWAPHDETHEYLLGSDPKGQGKDRGYGMLLDWTAGVFMGEIRSENPDGAALRGAVVRLSMEQERDYRTRFNPMCVPETNGVGQEDARRLRDAGCRVFRRPARPGEKTDTDAFRTRDYGWNTDVRTRPLMLGGLQEGLRLHRLSTPNQDFIHAAGAWDPEEDPHLPDILSAAGLAVAGGKLLWGEMGSSVAMARRLRPVRYQGWGRSNPRPLALPHGR